MICVYEAEETDFLHNGICVLNPTSCIVREDLNGEYELEMLHHMDGRGLWKHLDTFNIIRAPTPRHETQLFRIYKISRILGKGICVNARHVFYDALYGHIKQCNMREANAKDALTVVLSGLSLSNTFHARETDITDLLAVQFSNVSPASAILDEDTGLLALYGGELERNNYSIAIRASIGEDKGVTIRYGKNLTGLEYTEDIENTATRVIPYYRDKNESIYLPEYFIDSPLSSFYPFLLTRSIEISGFETGDKSHEMRTQVQDMYKDGIDLPAVNIKVEFVNLEKTEQYKDYKLLETVHLGDTVTVIHTRMGVDIKAKCIRIVFDCLAKRYDQIELGEPLDGLGDSVYESSRGINGVYGAIDSIWAAISSEDKGV